MGNEGGFLVRKSVIFNFSVEEFIEMEDLLLSLLGLIANGDSRAILGVFFCLSVFFGFTSYQERKEIKRLTKELVSAKDNHIKSMDDHLAALLKSNAKLASALNEIRVVLETMRQITR